MEELWKWIAAAAQGIITLMVVGWGKLIHGRLNMLEKRVSRQEVFARDEFARRVDIREDFLDVKTQMNRNHDEVMSVFRELRGEIKQKADKP